MLIILGSKHDCSLLQSGALSVSFKAVCYTVWKDSSEKIVVTTSYVRCTEMQEIYEEFYSNNIF